MASHRTAERHVDELLAPSDEVIDAMVKQECEHLDALRFRCVYGTPSFGIAFS